MTETEKLKQAVELLRQCEAGFSAYIMGRKMKRKERDALRLKIQELLSKI